MTTEAAGPSQKRLGSGRDVTWRLLEGVGLEHSRLLFTAAGPLLSGVVVTVIDGEPATIDYAVQTDRHWHTREVTVELNRAGLATPMSLHLLSDGDGGWWKRTERADGQHIDRPVKQIIGCTDIDLAFSPATNILPINRLQMTLTGKAPVTAAWIQLPSLEISTLSQQYLRFDYKRFRYESYDLRFHATIEVDDLGMVVSYQDLWERVASADIEPAEELNHPSGGEA